jgi:hypothetical protein
MLAREFQRIDQMKICWLDILRLIGMIRFQTRFARLVSNVEILLRGRRALRELQFAKYNVTPRLGKRLVQERLLRRFRSI